MPKRDDDLLISDMIDCCVKIMDYVNGMDYASFINDNKTVDAVIRNFEVLGEACKYISGTIKSNNPHIEWRKIGDFRNILIHDYFGINYETLWKIIVDELPGQLDFLQQLNALNS
ncbi:MAG: DUF86 domain-containing protein [Ginsengibacter sp.]